MTDFSTWPTTPFDVTVAGRTWTLERIADLETLWDAMDEDGDDEHIPYWVELWPASLTLAQWIVDHKERLRGRTCLDLGCGMGLTALVAASLGARVVAMDYEWPALFFARRNTRINHCPSPLWVQMDWCRHGFAPGSFDYIWGGDILYEKRFFSPIETMFTRVLAPGGRIILSTPERSVSRPVWGQFIQQGWKVEKLADQRAALQSMDMAVQLMQLTR